MAALVDRRRRRWHLRALRADDGERLAAYFVGLSPEDYARFHPHPLDRRTALALVAEADDPGALRLALFAEAACLGGILGYGFLLDWGEEAPLLGMSLAASVRGRGLGAAFTRHLVGRAEAAGKEAVRLTVYRDNLPAYRSYVGAGFRETGCRPDGWGGLGREEVLMRCPLRTRR